MRFVETWFETFDRPPVAPSSREVFVQEGLAELVTGRSCE